LNFTYINKKDGVLLFFGVLGSICQGFALPLIINNMGDIPTVLLNLVSNVTIKKITFIDDDNIL